jgi:hypothetical protein
LQDKNDVKSSKPYLHKIIVGIAHEVFFKNSSSFGVKYQEYFTSSLDGHDEPEIPMPLISMIATCVHHDTLSVVTTAHGSTGFCCSIRVSDQSSHAGSTACNTFRGKVPQPHEYPGRHEEGSSTQIPLPHFKVLFDGVWSYVFLMMSADVSPLLCQQRPPPGADYAFSSWSTGPYPI